MRPAPLIVLRCAAPRCACCAAERVEAEGDVATAFTLARIISNIPLARGGPGAGGRWGAVQPAALLASRLAWQWEC